MRYIKCIVLASIIVVYGNRCQASGDGNESVGSNNAQEITEEFIIDKVMSDYRNDVARLLIELGEILRGRELEILLSDEDVYSLMRSKRGPVKQKVRVKEGSIADAFIKKIQQVDRLFQEHCLQDSFFSDALYRSGMNLFIWYLGYYMFMISEGVRSPISILRLQKIMWRVSPGAYDEEMHASIAESDLESAGDGKRDQYLSFDKKTAELNERDLKCILEVFNGFEDIFYRIKHGIGRGVSLNPSKRNWLRRHSCEAGLVFAGLCFVGGVVYVMLSA
jgi:hypothetical protein